jgi:hypothetical protein
VCAPGARESLWALVLPAAAFNFGRGLLTVQAITLSLEDYPHLAGTATGLSFCARALLAAAAIALLGLVYDAREAARAGEGEAGARPALDASPVPLSLMMLAFSVASALVYAVGQRRADGGRPAPPEGRRDVRLAALDADGEAGAGKGELAAVVEDAGGGAGWAELGLDARDDGAATPAADDGGDGSSAAAAADAADSRGDAERPRGARTGKAASERRVVPTQ